MIFTQKVENFKVLQHEVVKSPESEVLAEIWKKTSSGSRHKRLKS